MSDEGRSPRFTHAEWGRLETEDGGRFKDAKAFPGGAREWDWNETGTRHVPGIQPADVDELLARGARVVVLSNGMLGKLQVRPETIQHLQRNGVAIHVARTRAAIGIYNRLSETDAVGGLFHSTC